MTSGLNPEPSDEGTNRTAPFVFRTSATSTAGVIVMAPCTINHTWNEFKRVCGGFETCSAHSTWNVGCWGEKHIPKHNRWRPIDKRGDVIYNMCGLLACSCSIVTAGSRPCLSHRSHRAARGTNGYVCVLKGKLNGVRPVKVMMLAACMG